MTERLPCRTEGCAATILPVTAVKTGGICMPCHQKKLRLEEEAYIASNRRYVDPYAGVTSPVEILKIMHVPKKHDPLEVLLPYPKDEQALYRSLTADELEQMEEYAIALIQEGEQDQAEEILLSLVCIGQVPIHRGLEALVESECFYPGILFKDALPTVRNQILQRMQHNSDNRSLLLSALAWIGDEVVVSQFDRWRASAPHWASELYASIESYTREAGWELGPGGSKRVLFQSTRHAFRVDDQGIEHRAVTVRKNSQHACPWCNSMLQVLFDCDLRDPVLRFLNLEGERLRLAACMHCAAYYGIQFMEWNVNGHFRWSAYNQQPYHFSKEPFENTEAVRVLRMEERPSGSYEASYWTLQVPATQIGGHPAWIQHSDYPACPCCSETMTFVAQLDMEQIEDGEGIYYVFLCRRCRLSATSFQQT